MDYNYNDILSAYEEVGIKKGAIISLKTDLRWLGCYDHPEPAEVLNAHFSALCELVDLKHGTIVVPTGSPSLCNTDTVFDPDTTPSEVGVLTEFIRKQPGAVRSFHPFISYTAIGRDAKDICGEVARHPFGLETPHIRLVDRDALEVSIGLHPRLTCSLVHHIEMVMGVPYRYVKEFIHPVVRNGQVVREPFYMNVWYRECNIERDDNTKIFEHYLASDHQIRQAELGRGNVYSYSLREFYSATVELFRGTLYTWLAREPEIKPYRL